MAKKVLRTNYFQIMERSAKGMILIGQPIKGDLAKRVKKEMFAENPNIIAYPSVAPQRNKLKKVM